MLSAVMDNEGDVEFTSDIDDPGFVHDDLAMTRDAILCCLVAILVSACQSNESAYEVTGALM